MTRTPGWGGVTPIAACALLGRAAILWPAMAPPVHLVFGDDDYTASTRAKELLAKLVPPGNETFGLECIEARVDSSTGAVQAIEQCVSALRTVGFLGGGKVVWLRDATFLEDSQATRGEAVKEKLSELAEMIRSGLPAGQTLVITAVNVDKRTAFFKACQAKANVHEYSLPKNAEGHASGLVERLAKEKGLQMPADVVRTFVERAGSADTRVLASEVEKLSLFLGARKQATVADVLAVVTAGGQAVLWDLADAFGNRDLPRALGLVRQLVTQKESAIGLIVALESRVRELLLIRDCMERKWLVGRGRNVGWSLPPEADALFSGAMKKDPRTLHPFRLSILVGQAEKFTLRELRRDLDAVVAAHERLVSSTQPAPLVLDVLLTRLLG